MKIAFIYNEKKIGTGAHYINDLIALKLRQRNIAVKNFYPKTALMDPPAHLKGLANIFFFFSLLEHKQEILRYSIIQGTTYTPLPFLALSIPVVTHFGSTTGGFLKATPFAKEIEPATKSIWYSLRKSGVIKELNLKTRRPLRDIAEIEYYAAEKAAAVVATSEKVKRELVAAGISLNKIEVIHNAIEDYWFGKPIIPSQDSPQIVFLGRLGHDVLSLKLKGVDRLIHFYKKFPNIKKTTVCMTGNKALKNWLKKELPNHTVFTNVKKDLIPNVLRPLAGGILFVPSRYEGFSLSLVEGMSQGLIPIVYSVGVAPEIIRNGTNGFIVKNQNEAIRRAKEIMSNKIMRRRMSLAALATAQQFRSDVMISKLLDFYRRVLRDKRNTRP
ncbi:MAG: glycosyltransferase family 4 protein [bacterium]|nr:glycosyltransferase family 4 protein [bacterium]